MDVHVPAAISQALIKEGVDVLTAQADETTRMADPDLLDRATSLGRVLVTRDEDFLAEGALRQRTGVDFWGIVYAHQNRVGIGQFIRDLRSMDAVYTAKEIQNRIFHLPLPDA